MKQFFFCFILICTSSIILLGQNTNVSTIEEQKTTGFLTTSSGLQYKIIKDSVGGNYPEAGGFITFWFEIRTINDSIMDSQFADPNPVGIPTPKLAYKASIEEGLTLLTEGDSALFMLNADSLYINTFKREIPSYIEPQSTIKMIVKMAKVYSKYFVDSAMTEQRAEQTRIEAAERIAYENDSIAIQKYLTDHKLKAERIEAGIYIVKRKSVKRKNPYIVRGEIVETAYIGQLLIEGTEFDRSTPGNYFQFTVGIGEVIKGWDYAFQRLKLGEKALILIPSGLAYGALGAGEIIPPNAPLLFEVEIKK